MRCDNCGKKVEKEHRSRHVPRFVACSGRCIRAIADSAPDKGWY